MLDFFVILFDLLSIFYYFFFYIGIGIILYELCKVNGLENKSLLSFLPIGNVYIMVLLLGERVHLKFNSKYLWVWYGAFLFLSLFLGQLSIVTFVIVQYLIFLFLLEFYGSSNLKVLVFHFGLSLITLGLSFIYSSFKFRTEVIAVSSYYHSLKSESFKDIYKRNLDLLVPPDEDDDEDDVVSNSDNISIVKSNNKIKSNRKSKSVNDSDNDVLIESRSVEFNLPISYNDSIDIDNDNDLIDLDFSDNTLSNSNSNSKFKSEIDSSTNRTGINL